MYIYQMEEQILEDLEYGDIDVSMLKPKSINRQKKLSPEVIEKKRQVAKENGAKRSAQTAERKKQELEAKAEANKKKLEERMSKLEQKREEALKRLGDKAPAKKEEPAPEPAPEPVAEPAPKKRAPAKRKTRTVIIQESTDSEDYIDKTEDETESEEEVIYVKTLTKRASANRAPRKDTVKEETALIKQKRQAPAQQAQVAPQVVCKFV